MLYHTKKSHKQKEIRKKSCKGCADRYIFGKFHLYISWNIPYFTLSILVMHTSQNPDMSSDTYTPKSDKRLQSRWRKKKPRKVNYTPTLTIWEPVDWPKHEDTIVLWHDELEALRLKWQNKLGVISAAKQMWISKSLFAKIYNEAVAKVSNALIHWKSMHIDLRNAKNQWELLANT